MELLIFSGKVVILEQFELVWSASATRSTLVKAFTRLWQCSSTTSCLMSAERFFTFARLVRLIACWALGFVLLFPCCSSVWCFEIAWYAANELFCRWFKFFEQFLCFYKLCLCITNTISMFVLRCICLSHLRGMQPAGALAESGAVLGLLGV